MTHPRRPIKSKPQVDAMEQRLVLSQAAATAAPVAQAIVHRPPALVQLQQRIAAEPQAQAQGQIQAQLRLQTLADAQRRIQANQDPGGPQAARAAQREEMRLQMEQRREQARERREQQAKANPNPGSTYKVQASSTDTGGFSFSKIWKSIFPW